MSFLNKVRYHVITNTVILVVIVVVFNRLLYAFFQQDEWWTFGNIIASEPGGIWGYLKDNLLNAGKVHAIPIAASIPYIEYKLFKINFSSYAITSVSIHFITSFISYYFSYLLLNRRILAILVALLFAVNSISYEAVTWVAAVNTQIVVLFSLLCITFFLKYLRSEFKKRYLNICFIFLFIALFSNESAFALFLILPVFWLIHFGTYNKKMIVKFILPLSFFGMLYLVIRISIWIVALPIILGKTQLLTQPNVSVFLFRLIALPFRVLVQTIIPQSMLLNFSEIIMRLGYPQFIASDNVPNPFLRETIFFDLVCLLLSIPIFLFLILAYHFFRRQKSVEIYQSFLIALSLIFLSGMMLIFIPGKAGFVSLFEPKHLYLLNIGSSIVIVLGIYTSVSIIVKKKNTVFFTVILFIPFFLLHASKVYSNIDKLIEIGNLRKSFLVTVYNKYPKLPQRSLFYLESDKSYYGMPIEEKNLPVQSGFGRMLMIWYQEKEKFPPCFYKDLFLHDLLSEGYRECDGRGFGFFRNYERLLEVFRSNSINPDMIISYSWDSENFNFVDQTRKVGIKLKKDLSITQ